MHRLFAFVTSSFIFFAFAPGVSASSKCEDGLKWPTVLESDAEETVARFFEVPLAGPNEGISIGYHGSIIAHFLAPVGRLTSVKRSPLALVYLTRAKGDGDFIEDEFEIRFYKMFALSKQRLTFPLRNWTVKFDGESKLAFVSRGDDKPSVITFAKIEGSKDLEFAAILREEGRTTFIEKTTLKWTDNVFPVLRKMATQD